MNASHPPPHRAGRATARRRAVSGAALFFAGAGVSAALFVAPWDAPWSASWQASSPAPDPSEPQRSAAAVEPVWTASSLSPKQPLQVPQAPTPEPESDRATPSPPSDGRATGRAQGTAVIELARDLAQVRATLAALEQRVEAIGRDAEDALAAADPDSLVDEERERPHELEPEGLVAAGFDPDEAEALVAAEAREQLALLELRNRAGREGWAGTDRYREALRELTRGESSLRTSLDEDSYDRFLYGAGRDNRVRISSVIDGSPAADAGLQPGDLIVRYGDRRLYGYGDLRTVTQAGEPGEDTLVEVDRDGVPVEVVMPRGVLGVQIDSARVEP